MKYREFETSSGRKVLAGKDESQNEILMKDFLGKENIILHTKEAGSPFCVILEKEVKPSKKDIKETAVFCASKSHDWRDNKGDVVVHIFKGEDAYKERRMKTGMFGIKKFNGITIKKEEIEKLIK